MVSLVRGATKDKNGIWISNTVKKESALSKSAWERIYNFDLTDLRRDRADFDESKLADHLLLFDLPTKKKLTYLEIGCGPAHIGDYLLSTKQVHFIGVDFNYKLLLTLKHYFEHKGYSDFTLIYGDINQLPLFDNSVDLIYGGGVIEHLQDTQHVIGECYRVLRKGGICINTVPALNLFFILRIFDTIPFGFFRPLFDFIHRDLLKDALLKRRSGYQLAYTKSQLISMHRNSKFKDINLYPFAFHPSKSTTLGRIIGPLFYFLQKNTLTCAVYGITAKK